MPPTHRKGKRPLPTTHHNEKRPLAQPAKTSPPREAELFAYLRQRPLQVCTYDQILSDVWRSRDTAENRHILRQVIARLRLRLQKSNEGAIINHRNKGYEFRAFA